MVSEGIGDLRDVFSVSIDWKPLEAGIERRLKLFQTAVAQTDPQRAGDELGVYCDLVSDVIRAKVIVAITDHNYAELSNLADEVNMMLAPVRGPSHTKKVGLIRLRNYVRKLGEHLVDGLSLDCANNKIEREEPYLKSVIIR